MAQIRKPIPKTPAERVQEKIEPYDLVNYGKEPPLTKNRAQKVSVKDSRVKDFSVKLVDLDTAVLNHIKNNIKPTIYQNDELIEVPTIYAYPERWVAMQKEGYLRDANGKILSPLIVVNRTNIEKNRNIARNLDGNQAQLVHVFQETYNPKNAYDNFNVLNNRQPVKQFKVVAHPDYVTVTYELTIYTNFVEQLNRIIESIQYAENSYWGDKTRYYFRVHANTFSTVNQYSQDEDRVVTSKVTLNLHGYLIPDTVNAFLSKEATYVSKGQVIFNEKTVSLSGTKNTITKVINTSSGGGGTSGPTPALDIVVITYLNTNTVRKASSIVPPNAFTVAGTILSAPPGLPTTTVSNFMVYINGINVDSSYFTIAQVGANIVVTLTDYNVVSTGGLLPTDDIILVGKFT